MNPDEGAEEEEETATVEAWPGVNRAWASAGSEEALCFFLAGADMAD